MTELRHDLAEMELPELEQALESMGHARFHGRQLFQWVHKRGVVDFADDDAISGASCARSLAGVVPGRHARTGPQGNIRRTERPRSCSASRTGS